MAFSFLGVRLVLFGLSRHALAGLGIKGATDLRVSKWGETIGRSGRRSFLGKCSLGELLADRRCIR